MRAPIHSKKHVFQISQAVVAQGAIVNTAVVVAIEGAPSAPQHIDEGAIVKACYIELWVGIDAGSAIGSYTVIIYKDPGGNSVMSTANAAAIHDYDNKKNILFTGQGLVAPETGGVIPTMRGWYKIPKGKQRFGLGDQLRIGIRNNNAAATDIHFCGLAIYKEYT